MLYFFEIGLKYRLNLPLKMYVHGAVCLEGPQGSNRVQLSSIDSNVSLAYGVNSAPPVGSNVVPVAPVNPPVSPVAIAAPTPGVVDKVNPALKAALPNDGEPVYTSVPDPSRSTAVTQVVPHDWTIQHPVPEKAQDPQPVTISQMVVNGLKAVWPASASPVQIEQVKNSVTTPIPTTPAQVPGELAKQALVYQPSKINKAGSI